MLFTDHVCLHRQSQRFCIHQRRGGEGHRGVGGEGCADGGGEGRGGAGGKDNKEKEKQHPAAGQGCRGGWQEEEDEKEDQRQERNKNQNLKLVRQQSTRLTCKNQLIVYVPTMNNWYLEYTK